MCLYCLICLSVLMYVVFWSCILYVQYLDLFMYLYQKYSLSLYYSHRHMDFKWNIACLAMCFGLSPITAEAVAERHSLYVRAVMGMRPARSVRGAAVKTWHTLQETFTPEEWDKRTICTHTMNSHNFSFQLPLDININRNLTFILPNELKNSLTSIWGIFLAFSS